MVNDISFEAIRTDKNLYSNIIGTFTTDAKLILVKVCNNFLIETPYIKASFTINNIYTHIKSTIVQI